MLGRQFLPTNQKIKIACLHGGKSAIVYLFCSLKAVKDSKSLRALDELYVCRPLSPWDHKIKCQKSFGKITLFTTRNKFSGVRSRSLNPPRREKVHFPSTYTHKEKWTDISREQIPDKVHTWQDNAAS